MPPTANQIRKGNWIADLLTAAGFTLGGGGGALVVSYLGFNGVGGSVEALPANQEILKKVTVPSDGVILSVDVLMEANAQYWLDCDAGLQSDVAGAPSTLLGSSRTRCNLITGGAGDYRWFTFPVNLAVAAGDYWLCYCGNQSINVKYDVGTDQTFSPGDGGLKDGGLVAPVVTAKKYSMRAAFLAT